MRIFIFDRDDTLTFDAKGRNNLINPDFILPILESIDAKADSLWAIASASATGVTEDPAWQLISRKLPNMSQPIYAPVKRGIDGLSSRIHHLPYVDFVNVDNRPLEAAGGVSATDLQSTALEAILNGAILEETADTCKIKLAKGTTSNPFSFDFTFNKFAPIVFRFGQTKVTMTMNALRQHNRLLSSGDYKLFSIVNTLDKAKLKIDLAKAPELQALGITAIEAPSYYSEIKPKDIIFCDDKIGCYRLAEQAGFTAILANSPHASYLKEGDVGGTQSHTSSSSSSSSFSSTSYPADNSYLNDLTQGLDSATSSQVWIKLEGFWVDFQALVKAGHIHHRSKVLPMLKGLLNEKVDIGGTIYRISPRNEKVFNALFAITREKSLNTKSMNDLLKSIQDVITNESDEASLQQKQFYEGLQGYINNIMRLFPQGKMSQSSHYHDIIDELQTCLRQKQLELGHQRLSPTELASVLTSEKFSHDYSKLVAASVAHDKPDNPEAEQAYFMRHALNTLTKLSIDVDILVSSPEALSMILTQQTMRRVAFTLLAEGPTPLTKPTASKPVQIGMRALLVTSSVSTVPSPATSCQYLMELVTRLSEQSVVTDMPSLLVDKATNFRSLLAYALPGLRDKSDIVRLISCQPLIAAWAEEYHAAVVPAGQVSMVGLRDQASSSAGLASSSSPIMVVSNKSESSSDESISISPDSLHPDSHH